MGKMDKRASLLEKVRVRRCVKPPKFGTVVCRQIHIFSDASVTGYGAVAYLRLRDENDRVHCSFLMGKARLAPVKTVTISRLELIEATVSVRIGQLFKKELDRKSDLQYHVYGLHNGPSLHRQRTSKIPCIFFKSRAVNSRLLSSRSMEMR